MGYINEEKLSQILEEHKRWICTNKKEGKRADLSDANLSDANLSGANLNYAKLSSTNLSGANLTQVKNLSINKLSTVKSLYKAKLDPKLMKQVEDKYPHFLEEPKSEE